MRRKKKISCPKCGANVMRYDGKGMLPIDVACRNCRIRVAYIPERDEVKATEIPERNSGSGMRLWF